MTITIAKTDSEKLACFPIVQELRPYLKQEEFLEKMKKQEKYGFFLAFITDNDSIVSVAGLRISENFSEKFMYVDDLITAKKHRSKGYVKTFYQWIIDFSKQNNCPALELDSGVQRFDAHRFYLMNKMKIECHHFTLDLK